MVVSPVTSLTTAALRDRRTVSTNIPVFHRNMSDGFVWRREARHWHNQGW